MRILLKLALLSALFVAIGAFGQSATATVGVFFTDQLAPASTTGYLVTINGTQTISVAGLTYNNTTGILSGTPTMAGTYNVQVQQATSTVGVFVTNTLVLTVNPAGSIPPPATTLFCATDPNPACGVVLTWNAPAAPTDPTLAVTGYQVFRRVSTNPGAATQITTTAIVGTTYTDATIAPSTTYQYYVTSVDAAGTQSSPSNTVSVAVAAAPSVPSPATPVNLTGSVVN